MEKRIVDDQGSSRTNGKIHSRSKKRNDSNKTITHFGHTKAPENIDVTAAGNARPEVVLEPVLLNGGMSGHFR